VNPKRCFVIILSLGHAAFAPTQPVLNGKWKFPEAQLVN
jgi:hypothetical protein